MDRWRSETGTVSLVEAVLVMPLLALALGTVLHLGIYLLDRQVAVTAVQQGLTVATAADATTTAQGLDITRAFITEHSAARIDTLTATPANAATITMTIQITTPAVVPLLTRTVTVTQTANRERWIIP